MATIEELKEIIVRLNAEVLHQSDAIDELQRENDTLNARVAELATPSDMPAPKPKCLEDLEFDYIIEQILGKHLPPDQSLALSRDEVLKIEEEWRTAAEHIEYLYNAVCREETKTAEYREMYATERSRATFLEGALEDRTKEKEVLMGKIATLERNEKEQSE